MSTTTKEIESIAMSEHQKQINELQIQLQEKANELKLIKNEAYLQRSTELNFEMQQYRILAATAKMTPENIFFLATSGKEVGLSVMQSLKSLYIVNGRVSFFGSGLIARLTSNGYKINFENETEKGVTVKISKGEEVYMETVTDSEPILQKSNAMKIDKKSKMRHHAIKLIANFNLPHLLGGISVWEQDDIETAEKLEKGDEYDVCIEKLKNCQTKEELEQIKEEHKKLCSKDIIILGHIGDTKKRLGL